MRAARTTETQMGRGAGDSGGAMVRCAPPAAAAAAPRNCRGCTRRLGGPSRSQRSDTLCPPAAQDGYPSDHNATQHDATRCYRLNTMDEGRRRSPTRLEHDGLAARRAHQRRPADNVQVGAAPLVEARQHRRPALLRQHLATRRCCAGHEPSIAVPVRVQQRSRDERRSCGWKHRNVRKERHAPASSARCSPGPRGPRKAWRAAQRVLGPERS